MSEPLNLEAIAYVRELKERNEALERHINADFVRQGVREAEVARIAREECAKVCEEHAELCRKLCEWDCAGTAQQCADAIRARCGK